ncbi:hypothetical protein GX441_01880 [bacterium]|nr:hypothetical protein [bacterium]
MSKVTHERGVNAVLVKNWLSDRFGSEGLEKILAKLGFDARAMISEPKASEWYPAALMEEVYKVIDEELGRRYPEILVDYGRYAADKSVKGFLRYLTRLINIEMLIKRMPAFWKQYHKGGNIDAGEVSDTPDRQSTIISVDGFELGPAGCQAIRGYIEGILPMANVRDVKVKEKSCIYKGDESCTWQASWLRQ